MDVTHLDLTLAEEVVYGVACVVLPSGVRKVTPPPPFAQQYPPTRFGGQQGLASASGVRWHAVSLCNTCLTT